MSSDERLIITAVHFHCETLNQQARLLRERGAPDSARTVEWDGLHDDYHDLSIADTSERLQRLCQSMRAQSNLHRLLSLTVDPVRPDIDEHRAISAAIDGDNRLAAEALVVPDERTLRTIETSNWFGG